MVYHQLFCPLSLSPIVLFRYASRERSYMCDVTVGNYHFAIPILVRSSATTRKMAAGVVFYAFGWLPLQRWMEVIAGTDDQRPNRATAHHCWNQLRKKKRHHLTWCWLDSRLILPLSSSSLFFIISFSFAAPHQLVTVNTQHKQPTPCMTITRLCRHYFSFLFRWFILFPAGCSVVFYCFIFRTLTTSNARLMCQVCLWIQPIPFLPVKRPRDDVVITWQFCCSHPTVCSFRF